MRFNSEFLSYVSFFIFVFNVHSPFPLCAVIMCQMILLNLISVWRLEQCFSMSSPSLIWKLENLISFYFAVPNVGQLTFYWHKWTRELLVVIGVLFTFKQKVRGVWLGRNINFFWWNHKQNWKSTKDLVSFFTYSLLIHESMGSEKQ